MNVRLVESLAQIIQSLTLEEKRFLEEKTGLDQHSASASLEHQESQERPFYETATPEEKAKAFRQWAESHVSESPVLSDEAISRESIYGERGR